MVTSGEPVIRVSSPPQDGSSPRDDCRLWPRLWNPPDEGCGKPLEDEGCEKLPEAWRLDEGCAGETWLAAPRSQRPSGSWLAAPRSQRPSGYSIRFGDVCGGSTGDCGCRTGDGGEAGGDDGADGQCEFTPGPRALAAGAVAAGEMGGEMGGKTGGEAACNTSIRLGGEAGGGGSGGSVNGERGGGSAPKIDLAPEIDRGAVGVRTGMGSW